MKIKYYFNHLLIKEKILSFLLIPLILFLLFSIFKQSFLDDNIKIKQKQIKLLKSKVKKLKVNIFKPNNISTIKFIENIATNFNIQISSIKINKLFFDIKTIGNYQNSINFLIYLEQNMETISLQIHKDKLDIIIQGSFRIFNLSRINKLKIIDNIPNPFIQIKHRKTAPHNNPLQLIAIFDKTVCINDSWYNKGDIVGKYKLTNIFINHIELTKNDKILKLEVYKNE